MTPERQVEIALDRIYNHRYAFLAALDPVKHPFTRALFEALIRALEDTQER